MEERNGVRILRVRPFVPRYPSPAKRALFEASFMIRTLNTAVQSPLDAVVAVVPGLGGAVSALEIARRRAAPCGVIFQDLMGRAASQSGTAGVFVGEITSRLEKFIARTATGVGVVADSWDFS